MLLPVVFLLLMAAVAVLFFIGMINPKTILRWTKDPSRLRVFLYLTPIGFFLFLCMLISVPGESNQDIIEGATVLLEDGKFEGARDELEKIGEKEEGFAEAQSLLMKVDSLENEALLAELENNRAAHLESLKRELESIKNGVDFSSYRGTMESLQIELVLFSTWANTIDNSGLYPDDAQIQKLSEELKNRVAKLQVSEFPKMRAEYVKISAKELWRNDIDVYASGGRTKKYINLTGGMFAANANKQDFQNQIHEVLQLFRFKQARYRWYKGDTEYTYWDIDSKDDSAPVRFD